jgi:hypothetical protein
MEKRAWTARGKMLEVDSQVITALTGKNLIASRIFVTGEVADDYIGAPAAAALISINDVYYSDGAQEQPLFVETRQGTVRMTRFDPAFVWRCFNPDILAGLIKAENERMGFTMDPYSLSRFDYYEALIDAYRQGGKERLPVVKPPVSMDAFYHAVYLGCLLLLDKPGYMDVPAAEHFARREAVECFNAMEMRELGSGDIIELNRLRETYGGIEAITNPELNFIVGIYRKWGL